MAAVTAEVVIFAPPESFGTPTRIAPPPRPIGPRPFVQRENRIRAEPGDRQVGECQLSARIRSRPHRGAGTHGVVHHRRPRLRLPGQ